MSDQGAWDAIASTRASQWAIEKQADRALYALVVHMREEHGMSIRKIAQRTTLTEKHVKLVLDQWGES